MLAEQEHGERHGQIRDHKRPPGVEPLQVGDHHVDRNHGQRVRDHHRAQHGTKQPLPSREFPARKGIGAQHGNHDLAADAQSRGRDAVPQIKMKRHLFKQAAEVIQCRRLRPRNQ